jgi:hypothetical protein
MGGWTERDPRLEAFWVVAQRADWQSKVDECAEAAVLLATSGEERAELVGQSLVLLDLANGGGEYWPPHFVAGLIRKLALKDLPYSEDVLLALLRCTGRYSVDARQGTLAVLEHHFASRELPVALREECEAAIARIMPHDSFAEGREVRARLRRLLTPPAERDLFVLRRVDAWTDALLGILAEVGTERRERWIELLRHGSDGTGSKPGKAWQKRAQELIGGIGVADFQTSAQAVLEHVGVDGGFPVQVPGFFEEWADGDPTLISAHHADVLRGLIWATAPVATPELIQALGDAADRCFKKLPGIGPRAPKIANACVQALTAARAPNAVAQLSRLQTRVKHRSSRTQVEKALNTVAERSGRSRDEIEDMSVPSSGLTSVGRLEQTFGEFGVELQLKSSRDFEVVWRKRGGQAQKSVPSEVRSEHAEALKALKAQLKELEQQLPVQARRLEAMLMSQRSLALDEWRERFVAHPLLGYLTRKLIWSVGDQLAGFDGDRLVDVAGTELNVADARVSLWHPIDSPREVVERWRQRLDELGITQPFKQAHREIYILTDAERQTGTYSNRFAAHVLKQHQFSALCRERGWNYTLQGNWDSHNTPFIDLPQHELRVEFWVDPVESPETGDTGIFSNIVTDQVRFVRSGETEPLDLALVPPRLFSELLRDVDLFVGVCSVGNDPNWRDGGEARFRDYWTSFAFGDLNETAKTRRAALERLLPRLKIAKACTLEDRFLIVRGKLRTYRIHLGSSNIQMEPNQQYLCIVPGRSGSTIPTNVMLPFEGDSVLSVILSKAIMLANDQAITDPSIQSQIGSEYFAN